MRKGFNKQTLIRWKVYIDRSKMYVGYIQFLLIIFVFINSLDNNPVSQFVLEKPLIAVPVILVLFREEEIRNHARSNPVLRQIQISLDEVNLKLDKLEKSEGENRKSGI